MMLDGFHGRSGALVVLRWDVKFGRSVTEFPLNSHLTICEKIDLAVMTNLVLLGLARNTHSRF